MPLAPLLFLRVVRRHQEALDICSFELASADSAALPPFTAGAHIDVHLPGGAIRQYSLCNAPHERHRYLIAVLRDPNSRGGSIAMHELVKEGDPIYVSAPRNHFALAPHATHSVLLAGGIGVTPIMSMAEHLHAEGASFEMHYCTRSVDRTAFRERLAAAPFSARVMHHFDDGPDAQKLEVAKVFSTPDVGAHIYVCGPTGFLDYVMRTAAACQWPEVRLHFESFSPALGPKPGDVPFEVEVASSGAVYTVPANRSVLQVLLENGVDVPWSCEQGICGACLTPVLEGEPDHRDEFLTEEERARNDLFTPCCSRAKGPRLKLDL